MHIYSRNKSKTICTFRRNNNKYLSQRFIFWAIWKLKCLSCAGLHGILSTLFNAKLNDFFSLIENQKSFICDFYSKVGSIRFLYLVYYKTGIMFDGQLRNRSIYSNNVSSRIEKRNGWYESLALYRSNYRTENEYLKTGSVSRF